MKLKEVVMNPIQQEDGSIRLPKAIELSPDAISGFWGFQGKANAQNIRDLVSRKAEVWSDLSKGKFEPKVTEFYVPITSFINIDTEKRVIQETSDVALADMDIEGLAMTRAIAKIEASGLSETFNPALAINLNERGEEYGYGTNVSVCSNMNIMSTAHLLSNYNKVKGYGGSYTKLENKEIDNMLKEFFVETEHQFDQEQKKIEGWKNQTVSRDDFHRFLGHQFSKIQMVNYMKGQRRIREVEDKHLAVNGLQLGKIAIEANAPSYEDYVWSDGETDGVEYY